ncbi:MAG: hypothetical protein ABI806_13230 [Candidatus Solibacter sp.]
MTRPPTLARLLVRLACPPRDLLHVLGDLDAEFELQHHDRSWYWRQAINSLPSLIAMGLRRWEWEFSLLAIFMASAAPVLFIDAWWTYILCNIPLKAEAARGGDFALCSLMYMAAVSLCAGMVTTLRGLLLALPLAWVFLLLGEAATHSMYPAWFRAASLLVATLSLATGAWTRRKLDNPSPETHA